MANRRLARGLAYTTEVTDSRVAASKVRMRTNHWRDGRRGFIAACLGAAGAAIAAPQDPPNTTIKTDVKVVNVFASVRDKKGQIVRNLTQEDFAIDEDGRAQTIRYFARESDLELTLGLLVDTSGSQRRVIGEERSASYRFLDQVLREDKDIAFVIKFDHEIELVVDLTSSRKQLESGIYNLQVGTPGGGQGQGGQRRRGFGGTKLYDAVMLGSEDMMARQHGRKALIVMSDGDDRGSKVSLYRAIDSAQKADTLVYSIPSRMTSRHTSLMEGGAGECPCLHRGIPGLTATAGRFSKDWPARPAGASITFHTGCRSAPFSNACRRTFAISTALDTHRTCRRKTANSVRSI